jgi:hypothetical protein
MVGRSCSESSGIGPHNDSRGAPYDKNFPVNPSRTLDDSAAVRKAPRAGSRPLICSWFLVIQNVATRGQG